MTSSLKHFELIWENCDKNVLCSTLAIKYFWAISLISSETVRRANDCKILFPECLKWFPKCMPLHVITTFMAVAYFLGYVSAGVLTGAWRATSWCRATRTTNAALRPTPCCLSCDQQTRALHYTGIKPKLITITKTRKRSYRSSSYRLINTMNCTQPYTYI